jgi:hypothetical protein
VRRLIVTVCSLLVLCGGWCVSASAESSSPWWGLSTNVRPAALHAGGAASEVQELTATPGSLGGFKGVLFELRVGGRSVGLFASEEIAAVAELPQANAESVQKALEGAEFYGAGGVVVTEQPTAPGDVDLRVATTLEGPVAPLEAVQVVPGFAGTAHAAVVSPGRADGQLVVTAINLGDGPADGGAAPVRLEDVVPAGLEPVAASLHAGIEHAEKGPVSCSLPAGAGRVVSCSFAGVLLPFEPLEMRVEVNVGEHADSGELNTVGISGGGAASAKTISRPVQVGGEPRFGVEELGFAPEQAGGAPQTQAGSHPFQVTSTLTLKQGPVTTVGAGQTQEVLPLALPKDLSVLSPPGLVGNPTPFERCSDAQFASDFTKCAPGSIVGVAVTTYSEPSTEHLFKAISPIVNLVPSPGEPARFGFIAVIVPVTLDTSVRTGSDYGVTIASHNVSQIPGLLSSSITLWGVPGDSRHDAQRGQACLLGEQPSCPVGQGSPPPFLSMPTACTGPLDVRAQADSWQDPSGVLTLPVTETVPGMDGCNHLSFEPQVSVSPDVADASTPTGLTVKIHVPQTSILNAEGVAEGTVRDTSLTLPAGVTLNAGGADGLEACSEGEVGFLGKDAADVALNLFTPLMGEPFCPDAAKVGTVQIETPLLPNALEGAVYLASPAPAGEAGQNPFDGLLALYIVAKDPVSGTLVKLAGRVVPDPATGQLTSTFQETPQLPFENLTLHFFGGGRAPLATPALCGSYTTSATFVPWNLEAGAEPAHASSTFQITSGPNGSACPPSPRAFSPGFTAGSSNLQAGTFTPLVTSMGHADSDQVLSGLDVRFPPGLLGSLSSVKLCEEPQAAQGTCGAESLIGHTTVTAGLGSTPAVVRRAGDVYITGPYHGAPFGLSIVNPAETGPFDLERDTACDCVVVRARILIDPATAQLSVITDPLPTILKGVPLNIQHVAVTVDRPGFTFNPTSCSAMSVAGSVTGAEGATSLVSTPFQVTNCAILSFKPSFTVAVTGRTSKAQGAGLSVKLSYPPNSMGSEANIHSVKVELPKQLPSRLTTLQKACLAATFDSNPADCPPQSIVGHAVVHTPVLPVPLQGTAYFVSHGGEEFPNLTILLHGYGVTIELVGSTFISKAGITSTTFKSPPDVPFETFELALPQGPYSALAANTNLCAKTTLVSVKKRVTIHKHGRTTHPYRTVKKRVPQSLLMPTEFTGQNGAQIHENTKITVTGCPNANRLNKAHKTGHRRHKKH